MKPEYDLSKLKSRKNSYASKLKKPVTKRKLGALQGQIWIAPDFDEIPQGRDRCVPELKDLPG